MTSSRSKSVLAPSVSRRSMLSFASIFFAPAIGRASAEAAQVPSGLTSSAISASFPRQDMEVVREMVIVAHGNVARVKELVGRQQTLAKAAWDWGFGDWESALGAASHMGNREIAEFLLANGARPSIFSAAMMGQLDVVKAFVAASPGVQKIKGPHSITLLRHAMVGGTQAKPVVDYLTALGGADDRLENQPLTDAQRAKITGAYVYGTAPDERLEVTIPKDVVQMARPGQGFRILSHLGSLEFYPAGAENVRIRFNDSTGGVTLTVHDPDVVLTAKKSV